MSTAGLKEYSEHCTSQWHSCQSERFRLPTVCCNCKGRLVLLVQVVNTLYTEDQAACESEAISRDSVAGSRFESFAEAHKQAAGSSSMWRKQVEIQQAGAGDGSKSWSRWDPQPPPRSVLQLGGRSEVEPSNIKSDFRSGPTKCNQY